MPPAMPGSRCVIGVLGEVEGRIHVAALGGRTEQFNCGRTVLLAVDSFNKHVAARALT